MLKFLQRIAEDPGDYVDYWNLEEEQGVPAAMMREIVLEPSRRRRLTEERAGSAKSVFHYDVPGSVAKSTHAGLPWLRYLRQRLGDRVHFWPFDGWRIPVNGNLPIVPKNILDFSSFCLFNNFINLSRQSHTNSSHAYGIW